jgi:hypothetical protein
MGYQWVDNQVCEESEEIEVFVQENSENLLRNLKTEIPP